MGRSRSRSRSRGRGHGYGHGGGDQNRSVSDAAKSGNSEQEIVSVAIRQLPADIRQRLEKLFEEGLLKEGDLDLRSITVFASLNEGLQARVMNHMEGERIYVANARSKSGFLIATCDKAKTGCLDARGLGAIDPWRTALVAMATPKQKQLDLQAERDWLDKFDEGAVIKIQVKLGSSVEGELGVPSVTVELPMTETSAAIKAKLVAMGVKALKQNKMMLHTEPVGFLKEGHSFAYYNLSDNAVCALSERKRAGTRFRVDHTVMPKRPRTQPAPGEAPPSAPLDALKATAAGAKLPAFPAMPKLPGFPGAGGTAPGAGLLGLPGMPALPGLPGLPGGARPGLPGLPGLQLPGLPKPGGPLMPAAFLGGLAGSGPAAGLGGTMLTPGLGGTMPGLLGGMMPGLGDPKSKAPLLLPPGGDPKAAAQSLMTAMGGGDGTKPGGLLGGLPLGPGGGLPGLPPLGANPKAAAMAFMAKMAAGGPPGLSMPAPGLGLSGPMPGMPAGFPGMPTPKALPDGGGPPGVASTGATPKGASPA